MYICSKITAILKIVICSDCAKSPNVFWKSIFTILYQYKHDRVVAAVSCATTLSLHLITYNMQTEQGVHFIHTILLS